jgi:hypothetical protein
VHGYDSDMNDLTQAWATYLDVPAVEAPVTRAELVPAGELDLDGAQQELGLPLLPDLVTWFGLHGGSGDSFLPFGMALDLRNAVSDSLGKREIWVARETSSVRGTLLNPER